MKCSYSNIPPLLSVSVTFVGLAQLVERSHNPEVASSSLASSISLFFLEGVCQTFRIGLSYEINPIVSNHRPHSFRPPLIFFFFNFY